MRKEEKFTKQMNNKKIFKEIGLSKEEYVIISTHAKLK